MIDASPVWVPLTRTVPVFISSLETPFESLCHAFATSVTPLRKKPVGTWLYLPMCIF